MSARRGSLPHAAQFWLTVLWSPGRSRHDSTACLTAARRLSLTSMRSSSCPAMDRDGVTWRDVATGGATGRRQAAQPPGRGSASEATCTPGSVPRSPRWGYGDGHPSGAAGCPAARAADPRAPTARRCPGKPGLALLFGLAPGRACRVSPRFRSPGRGLVSVALVLASRRTGVTRYPAPWSPDVPHAPGCPVTRNRPVASLAPRFYPVGTRPPVGAAGSVNGRSAAPARRPRSRRPRAGVIRPSRGAARGRGASGRHAGAAAPRSRPAPRRRSGASGAGAHAAR